MFFKKKASDCKTLIDERFIGMPYQDRFFANASYSYPSHKEKEVVDRIHAQKKLIDQYGISESVHALAKTTIYSDEFFKFSDKLIQETPPWSDPKCFSQSSTRFLLNGNNYIAEQHGANFRDLICLYRNDEAVFICTSVNTQTPNGFATAVDIALSKLNEKEIQSLVALANTANVVAKEKRSKAWDKLMVDASLKSEEETKRRF